MNEEYINNSNIETESIVEDNSINEMEKSFTEEAMETSQENTETESIEAVSYTHLTLPTKRIV